MQYIKLIAIDKYITFRSIGLVMLWIGYFLPWIPHEAAALNMGAYDLSNWVMLLPEVQKEGIAIGRMNFLMIMALIVLLSFELTLQGGFSQLWWIFVCLGILIMIPSYPSIMFFRTDTSVIWQILLIVVTLFLMIVLWLVRNWRFLRLLQGFFTLLIGLACLLPFLLMRHILNDYYGSIPDIGVGWYVTLLGLLFVVCSGIVNYLYTTYSLEK